MQSAVHKNQIDRLSQADSVITLLGRVNVENFRAEERIAVATAQVEAIDEWLAAYLDSSLAAAAAGPSPRLSPRGV